MAAVALLELVAASSVLSQEKVNPAGNAPDDPLSAKEAAEKKAADKYAAQRLANARAVEKAAAAPPKKITPPAAVIELQKDIARMLLLKSGRPAMAAAGPGPEDKPNGWCDAQYEKVWNAGGKDRRALYGLISDHLLLVEKRLKHADIERRREGLLIAKTAMEWTLSELDDRWFAPRICDAYILPYWEWGNVAKGNLYSREQLLLSCIHAYETVGDQRKYVECYRMLLGHALELHDGNTADFARFKLAAALAKRGEHFEAIRLLEAIDPDGSLSGAREFIPKYKKAAAGQQPKKDVSRRGPVAC